MHRRLIELLAASGDRSSALHQFEQCVAILERELGVDPLPETLAVYQAVLEPRPLPSAVLEPTPGWTTLPSLNVGLIGQRSILQQLDGAFKKAQAGRGNVVLISGEPGIGKSRIMQEFAKHLEDEALVVAGAGHRDTQTTPYQLIIEALRQALRARYSWFNAPRCCLAEASQLLPELGTLYPGLTPPPATGDRQARTRLFEALRNLTIALAAGPQPLLLCLDNLQWADATTLDWIAYLGRHMGSSRLLVVGTYRADGKDTIAELRRNLTRQGKVTELKLRRLDQAALARHFAQAEKPGRAARYTLQAGRATKAVFAHIEARSHFDQALALLRQEAAHLQEPDALANNQTLQVEAFYERGWALRLLGDMEAYARDLEQVAHLAESLGDSRTLAHLRWREAYTHRWFCRYPPARQSAEAGLCLSQENGDHLLEAQCWREIGLAARETADRTQEILCLLHLGWLSIRQKQPAEAIELLQTGLDLAVQIGSCTEHGWLLSGLAEAQRQSGDLEKAAIDAQRALHLAQATDRPYDEKLARRILTRLRQD